MNFRNRSINIFGPSEVISNFPQPTTVKQFQRFIGMINFYHVFIPKFAEILNPLYLIIASMLRNREKIINAWLC